MSKRPLQPHDLIVYESPTVRFASNDFIRVPTILQYDATPLFEVVETHDAGFTTQFQIYHPDGTYLAKVKGSQIYPTAAGKKAGLKMKYPDKMTVCELDGKTLFEISRTEAAALKTAAELHTPDGVFLKANEDYFTLNDEMLMNDAGFHTNGLSMTNCTVSDFSIGIHIKQGGAWAVGVG